MHAPQIVDPELFGETERRLTVAHEAPQVDFEHSALRNGQLHLLHAEGATGDGVPGTISRVRQQRLDSS